MRRIHTRSIICDAYATDDGLCDIEATLRDVKPMDIDVPGAGVVKAGDPAHDLTLRVTIDNEKRIRKVMVKTGHVPYAACTAVAATYRRLEGATIGPGFTRLVKEMFRSTDGCTHFTELLPVIATVAYQVSRDRQRGSEETDGSKDAHFYIDSCYTLKADGELVREHFPQFYKAGTDRKLSG